MSDETKKAVLLALAARAEAGGDETLSDDVWRDALGWKPVGEFRWASPDGKRSRIANPPLDTSLDAQAALPGRIVSIHWSRDRRDRRPTACIAWIDDETGGTAPTEPLARLAALLRAMSACHD